MIDHNGSLSGLDNFDGFKLIYFGFTNCPDVCPIELEKTGRIVNGIEEKHDANTKLVPVFITCDPMRDTPETIKQYLQGSSLYVTFADFHTNFIGFTGPAEDVARVCKQFRVYFKRSFTSQSTSSEVERNYLVDHSVFFYLVDPDGQFVDVYGKDKDDEECIRSISLRMQSYQPTSKSTF